MGSWLNQLLRAAKSHAPVNSAEVIVNESSHGATLSIRGSSGGSSEVRQFRLVSIQNDFYSARLWDGEQEVGEEVYIARPFEHRVSDFDGRSIAYSSDGDAFTATFDYSSPTKRTKTIGTTVETQVLTPYFKDDFHLIYAVEVRESIKVGAAYTPLTDPNEQPISLLDLNVDGRAWTKI